MSEERKLMPIGTYDAVIGDVQYTEAKTGTLQLALTIKLTDGNTRTVFYPLTDNAASWVGPTLQELGYNQDPYNPAMETQGQTKKFYCKHEEYGGVIREKWMLSRGVRPVSGDRRDDLRVRLKGMFGAPKKPAQSAAQSAVKPAASSSPPTRTSPPPDRKKPTFSRDSLWDMCLKSKKSADDYTAAIEAVEQDEGVAEADFTEDHWHKVAQKLDPNVPPF